LSGMAEKSRHNCYNRELNMLVREKFFHGEDMWVMTLGTQRESCYY
jgi:hypothetical protein